MTKHSPEAKAAWDCQVAEVIAPLGMLGDDVSRFATFAAGFDAAMGVRLQATREAIKTAVGARLRSNMADPLWLIEELTSDVTDAIFASGVISEAPKQDAESGNPPAPIQGDERNTP